MFYTVIFQALKTVRFCVVTFGSVLIGHGRYAGALPQPLTHATPLGRRVTSTSIWGLGG